MEKVSYFMKYEAFVVTNLLLIRGIIKRKL